MNAPKKELCFCPWTDEQVDNLIIYQNCGYVHPFTCGNCDNILVPQKSGWYCPTCPYTQSWAHWFMVDFKNSELYRVQKR